MEYNREKSNIAIAILKKLLFLKGKKIISHFGGSNNIFADCNTCFKISFITTHNSLESHSTFLSEIDILYKTNVYILYILNYY